MTCKHSAYKDGLPVCRKGLPVQLLKCMGKDEKLLKCYEECERDGATKKLPEREQVNTKTLRLSDELDEAVATLASSTGASYNSTLCLLIRLGLKHFE